VAAARVKKLSTLRLKENAFLSFKAFLGVAFEVGIGSQKRKNERAYEARVVRRF